MTKFLVSSSLCRVTLSGYAEEVTPQQSLASVFISRMKSGVFNNAQMRQIIYLLFLAVSLPCIANDQVDTDVVAKPSVATYHFFKRSYPFNPDQIYLTLSDGALSPTKDVIGEGFRLTLLLTANIPDAIAESDSIAVPTGTYIQEDSYKPGIMGTEVIFTYNKTIDGKLITYSSHSSSYNRDFISTITVTKQDDGYLISGDKYVQIYAPGQQRQPVVHITIPETKIQIKQEYAYAPAIEENSLIDFTKHKSSEQKTKVSGEYSIYSDGLSGFYPQMGNITLHIFDTPTFEEKSYEPNITNGAGRVLTLRLNTLYGIDSENMDYKLLCGEYQAISYIGINWPGTFVMGSFNRNTEYLSYYPQFSYCEIYDENGLVTNATAIAKGFITIKRETDGKFSISGNVSESSTSFQRNKEVPFSFYWRGDLLGAIDNLPPLSHPDNLNTEIQGPNATVITNLLGEQVNAACAGFKIVKEGNRVVKKFVK